MGSLPATILQGALAGALATKAMDLAASAGWRAQDRESREREERVREGLYSSEVAAQKTARLLGRELDRRERERASEALHWGLGIGAGVAYALLRRRWPQVAKGQGLAFGAAFFLLVDEGVNAAFGFTPPPEEFPWQSHARGLAGHLAYGVAAESALDAMDRILPDAA